MKGIIKALFLTIIVASTLSSCLEPNKNNTENIAEKPVITKFVLKGNRDIEGTRFSIDQDSLLIYNNDSISLDAKIDSLYAIITPRFHKVYVNDSIDLYLFDTLWMNFNNPIKYTVVAADKKKQATYRLKINRHTVDPDTVVWTGTTSQVMPGITTDERAVSLNDSIVYLGLIDGKLYIYLSTDGTDWKQISYSGMPADMSDADLRHTVASDTHIYTYIGGKLYATQNVSRWENIPAEGVIDRLLFHMNNTLYAVAKDGTEQTLMALKDNKWQMVTTLPFDFPVTGEAIVKAPSVTGANRIFVAGGIDSKGKYLSSVWSTENCTYWSNLTTGSKDITPRAYGSIVQYAEHLFLIGGKNDKGEIIDEEFSSKDYGINWKTTKNTKMCMPDLYVRRYDLSAISVPQKGLLFLVGGRASDDTSISDVWRGLNYASIPGFNK